MVKIKQLDLIIYMKEYIAMKAPGLLEMLNTITRAKTGKNALELFLSSPTTLYKILSEHYMSPEAALFAMANLFIRPLVLKLGKLELEDALLKAATEDDNKFKEMLKSLGVEIKD
ncbi:hypothetical protein J4526_07850 [Desulfurococcaceae archaeon MEX13E-LK6-19]|nr:hypothetical protein J4526_07850 [Desulfurococcaceae archaeon MEX13E-LK6-19]